MHRMTAGIVGMAGLVAVACAGGGDDVDTAADPTVDAERYAAEAAAFGAPPDDITFPDVRPEGPVGSYGFSNYVWTVVGGEAVPILIEGPRGQQFRCQDPDLPCSYRDLKELHESGDPIPPELGMTTSELAELVSQLDETHDVVAGMESIDDACAAGYVPSSSQNANMGIHMTNATYYMDGVFDPSRPEMVLFAKEDGYQLRQSEIGGCVGGRWEGEAGFQAVGAVFTAPLTATHPEGFAGPIDNWHVHYNTCAGADDESTGGRLLGDPAPCEQQGGTFMEVIPTWMMHAYVMPEFDAQTGVFAMYNNAIWPLTTDEQLEEKWTEQRPDGGDVAPINNFDFGEIEVSVGDAVRFSNSDDVPHTVTDSDGRFDSGLFGSGEIYTRTFDQTGEYAIYCSLHPQMTGTVTVTE